MKTHKHHPVANTPEVFSSFVGCCVKGVVRQDSETTLVFDCGWGLTFNHEHGSFWAETPEKRSAAPL